MNIKKIEYFITLSKTLNYSEAADQLFTTQGNVSKQIIALEKELELTLIDRNHKKVALTAAGKALLPQAKRLYAEYQQLMIVANEYKIAAGKNLLIHGIPTMSDYGVLEYVARFHKIAPTILLQVEEWESNRLFENLDEQKCDLIVARTFKPLPDHYESILLAQEKLVVVLPKNHRLAQRKSLAAAELKDEDFILLAKTTNVYEEVIYLCNEAGFQPKISYYGQRLEMIENFIANEMGISILTEKAADKFDKETITLVALESDRESSVSFIRKKRSNPTAVKEFWQFLKETVSL